MSVPPPTDEDEPLEFTGETTFDESFWRDYAVDVVGYRTEWVDDLLEDQGVAGLVEELGSRVE